jgi:hypothetical protein
MVLTPSNEDEFVFADFSSSRSDEAHTADVAPQTKRAAEAALSSIVRESED